LFANVGTVFTSFIAADVGFAFIVLEGSYVLLSIYLVSASLYNRLLCWIVLVLRDVALAFATGQKAVVNA
jgi:hypothetical protein